MGASSDSDFFQGEFVNLAGEMFTGENKLWHAKILVQVFPITAGVVVIASAAHPNASVMASNKLNVFILSALSCVSDWRRSLLKFVYSLAALGSVSYRRKNRERLQRISSSPSLFP